MPLYYSTGEQTQTVRYDKDGRSDSQPVYIGFAEKGTGQTELKWTIHKFTYDANNYPTHRRIAIGAWDSRTTLTYE